VREKLVSAVLLIQLNTRAYNNSLGPYNAHMPNDTARRPALRNVGYSD